MKKQASFSPAFRINAVLCCSAAVLLSACGGNADTIGAMASQTAATISSSADAAGALVPNTVDAAANAVSSAAASFELSGYDGTPASSGAQAASGQPRLLASITSSSTATGTPTEQVTALYRTVLKREPDAAGLAYWSNLVASGVPISYVESQFKASQEYANLQASTGATTPAATAIPATTYNYYVSPTGSDTAAGTKAAPFKTLARAAKAATKASTTVWVAPGTYAGGIKTTASGTATGRIYWVSSTKWGAKIVPPSSSTNNNAWDNRGNYVSIIGFDVDGTNSGSGTKWTHGIYTGGSYGMIQDNHIHHIARSVACTSAGGSAIGVDSYYHGVKSDIVSNVVNDIGPAGCTYVQGIYVSTSGTIKNNLVYRVGAVGIHLWHDATDVVITNNTVTSSNFGMVVGGGDFYYTTAGANNVFVANNIIYDNKYGISEQGKTGTANKYVNNLVFQNPTYNISLRNGLQATGTVSSNPLFKAYSRTAATPDFHLTTSSPAIGRGTATNAYPTDLDGKPRNATTGYDIGAYQH
jgi:parallel beta-helix repeat protein